MLIKTFEVGQLSTNCYIVTDEQSLKCAVIDPGAESGTLLDYIEENGLTVEAYLLTHGHFDHTMALNNMLAERPAPVYINEKDVYTDGPGDSYKLHVAPGAVNNYGEGDCVQVGALKFYVIETPGHSAGSVTLMCGRALFTGDTLFRGSCGRTDLPGSDATAMLKSLRRLAKIDAEFEVYPGHMESSTLSVEKASNYFIQYAMSIPE